MLANFRRARWTPRESTLVYAFTIVYSTGFIGIFGNVDFDNGFFHKGNFGTHYYNEFEFTIASMEQEISERGV